MKKFIALLSGLFVVGAVNADLIGETVKGSTDYGVELTIIDLSTGVRETGVVFNTAGIDLWYRREGAVSTDITEATLAALTTAHSDGGFLHINDGVYRLDLPDAAVASGADFVSVGGTVTGMIVIGGRVKLTDVDMNDGVRAGMTALPNAAADAAGGLPISDAGGLDLDGLNTNVTDIETDTADMQPKFGTITDLGGGSTLGANNADMAGATFATADDSLEALRNRGDAAWTTGSGTGMTPLFSGTMQSGSTSTTAVLASATNIPNDNPNYDVQICIHTGTGLGQCRTVEDFVSSTDTVTVSRPWTTTPDNTSQYEGWPAGAHVNAWAADITSVEQGLDDTAAIADAVRGEPCGTETADTLGDLICNDVEGIANGTIDVDADVVSIESLDPTDQINASADAAIETYHLDHLLAADYDPASKPGVGTALLNEVVESDGGVSRLTANALENAPSGSADWSASEVQEIRGRLGITGTTAAGGNTPTLSTFDASSDTVDVGAISGDTTAADNAELFFDGTGYAGANNTIGTVTTVSILNGYTLATGTCDSGSTTTCVDAALTEADDYWKGAAIVMTSGSAAGQTSCIYDFTASSDTLLFRPFTAAVSTDTYIIVENAVCEGVVAP